MPNIDIIVKNKIAYSNNSQFIVCGNDDYKILFDFDSEWENVGIKTARFTWGGVIHDEIFEGNECAVPIIEKTSLLCVGVFVGNKRATTDALIICKQSTISNNGLPANPPDDVYTQILEKLETAIGEQSYAKNIVDGDGSFSLLQKSIEDYPNTATNKQSVTLGQNNKNDGHSALVVGQSNTNKNSGSITCGNSTSNNGAYSMVAGIKTKNSTEDNSKGWNSIVFGNSVWNEGDNSLVGGIGLTDENNVVVDNSNEGNNSIVVGNHAKNTKNNSLVVGLYTKNTLSENATILGKYNEDKSNLLLSVGYGNNEEGRKNALEVNTSGTTTTNHLVTNTLKVEATGVSAFSCNGRISGGADIIAKYQLIGAKVSAGSSGLSVNTDKFQIDGNGNTTINGTCAIAKSPTQDNHVATKKYVDDNKVDVQINGTSIVKDGVANIPIAQAKEAGLAKFNSAQGLYVGSGGEVSIVGATEANINAKTDNYKPITAKRLDYAVKTSVTTNTIALTDEEKSAAQEWLGTKLYRHNLSLHIVPADNAYIFITVYSRVPTRLATVALIAEQIGYNNETQCSGYWYRNGTNQNQDPIITIKPILDGEVATFVIKYLENGVVEEVNIGNNLLSVTDKITEI